MANDSLQYEKALQIAEKLEMIDSEEIDSKKHVIQQCMDIILDSMNFKLNEFDKIKDEQTG